jgi:hypothetical protein
MMGWMDSWWMVTHFGYPTPVNPDHPMYAPLGKCSSRSSGRHSFWSIDGRRMRSLRSAETAGDAAAALRRRAAVGYILDVHGEEERGKMGITTKSRTGQNRQNRQTDSFKTTITKEGGEEEGKG